MLQTRIILTAPVTAREHLTALRTAYVQWATAHRVSGRAASLWEIEPEPGTEGPARIEQTLYLDVPCQAVHAEQGRHEWPEGQFVLVTVAAQGQDRPRLTPAAPVIRRYQGLPITDFTVGTA